MSVQCLAKISPSRGCKSVTAANIALATHAFLGPIDWQFVHHTFLGGVKKLGQMSLLNTTANMAKQRDAHAHFQAKFKEPTFWLGGFGKQANVKDYMTSLNTALFKANGGVTGKRV